MNAQMPYFFGFSDAPHPNEPPLVSEPNISVPLTEPNLNQNTQDVMGKLSSTNPSCKGRAPNPPKSRDVNKTKTKPTISLATSSGNMPLESPEVSPLKHNHSGVMCPFEVDDVDEPCTTEEAGQVEMKAAVGFTTKLPLFAGQAFESDNPKGFLNLFPFHSTNDRDIGSCSSTN
ncbi:hypothetical protein PHET_10228 [Paragonimus heterotremus]|uniref:Uncharacterized protein n=1 Tax=Paragonimus heterotremus TaxID=100268 RepID=A0A8J4SLJ4_9TREM|nr:hypothetical protein PHET_10228 [Paragonimus heterotremus]